MIDEMKQLAALMEIEGEPTGMAEIHSSPADFWEFVNGPLWGDLKRELLVWYDQMGRVYDTLKVGDDDFQSDFGRAQGRREAIEHLLMLPELMIEALEAEKEEDDGTGRDETSDS